MLKKTHIVSFQVNMLSMSRVRAGVRVRVRAGVRVRTGVRVYEVIKSKYYK